MPRLASRPTAIVVMTPHRCPCTRRQLDELVRTSEERMAKLRAELLLREENYNKHFKNGGAGEKVGSWVGLGRMRSLAGRHAE